MEEAGAFLRRLIPFPGGETAPLAPLPLTSPVGVVPPNTGLAQGLVDQPGASIVSQAASILDEEMARGVLAASGIAGATPGRADTANPLLRQAHELVDSLARVWPGLQTALSPSAGSPVSSAEVPVVEVGPSATVRPGQRATISMAVRNSETHAVRIVPLATDLIGSRKGRITSSLLEISPPELILEPGQERDLTISTIVPPDTEPGCYSGLLVVSGIDYLRAVITIDVA